MRDLLNNFLKASITNTHPMIPVVLVVIYLMLILNCFLSMRANRLSFKSTCFFSTITVLIPFGGMVIYLLWNLSKCDFNGLKHLLGNERPQNSK